MFAFAESGMACRTPRMKFARLRQSKRKLCLRRSYQAFPSGSGGSGIGDGLTRGSGCKEIFPIVSRADYNWISFCIGSA